MDHSVDQLSIRHGGHPLSSVSKDEDRAQKLKLNIPDSTERGQKLWIERRFSDA